LAGLFSLAIFVSACNGGGSKSTVGSGGALGSGGAPGPGGALGSGGGPGSGGSGIGGASSDASVCDTTYDNLILCDHRFPGAIGKVAIYDYLLGPAQIAAHYQTMTGKEPTGSCAASCVF